MSSQSKKLATKSAEIEVDDLLLEIFLRLPIYSIQLFIATCKNWHSLITTQSFRKQWRKHNLKPSTGLILRTRKPTSTYYVPFSSNKPHMENKFITKIKQSCNGLLLCSIGKTYHVYNPTTNESFTLPELGDDVVKPGTKIISMSLAFDPNKSSHYKVICFISGYPFYVHVYSSDTRCWESVSKPFPGVLSFSVNDLGVYWNGGIHWMRGLSYFDIGNEVFKEMPKPPGCGDWRIHHYFGESCDRLIYAKLFKPNVGDSCSVRVYELTRDYSAWVLKYHVELAGYRFSSTRMLSVVNGVEEDDSFLVLMTNEGIKRYNLVSQTSEELPDTLTGNVDRAFQYIESQCSVC